VVQGAIEPNGEPSGVPHTAPQGVMVHDAFPSFPPNQKKKVGTHVHGHRPGRTTHLLRVYSKGIEIDTHMLPEQDEYNPHELKWSMEYDWELRRSQKSKTKTMQKDRPCIWYTSA